MDEVKVKKKYPCECRPPRTFHMLIEGPGFSKEMEVIHSLQCLTECRRYYAKGIETKGYMMPGKILVFNYTKPVAIEKTYSGENKIPRGRWAVSR